MTENEANIYSIAYRDCKEVAGSIDVNEEYGKASTILFYMDEILEALKIASKLQEIGTVEGYELAINESIDKHNLMVVYKDRLKEFEAIGTIEELQDLKSRLRSYKDQMSIYAEQHKVILASDVLEALEELEW